MAAIESILHFCLFDNRCCSQGTLSGVSTMCSDKCGSWRARAAGSFTNLFLCFSCSFTQLRVHNWNLKKKSSTIFCQSDSQHRNPTSPRPILTSDSTLEMSSTLVQYSPNIQRAARWILNKRETQSTQHPLTLQEFYSLYRLDMRKYFE